MKFTALKKFFIILGLFFLLFVSSCNAQTYHSSDGVGVAAEVVLLDEQEIAIMEISGMMANPNPVRVGYIIKITVTMKGYDGMLLPFHSIELDASGPGHFELTQPVGLTGYDGMAIGYITSDVAGVYVVTATDTTYSEKDITIDDEADAIFIAEGIVILHSEPEYTQGYSNSLDWEPLENIVQYYIEASDDEDFKTVVFNSGWIDETDYEFTGLQDSKKYYFRVKGRNEVGANTVWSNVVFSTQDATPPTSEITKVEKVQNGFRVYIESEDSVGEVKLVDIYVKLDDGKWMLIKSTEMDAVNIYFSEIDGFDVDNKPERVCFYSRAEDTVGNLEVVDPGVTGDYCVGYGLTIQNLIDLMVDQSGKLLLIVQDGVDYLTNIVASNLLLFHIFVLLSILIYLIIQMYENKFRFSDLSKWLEVWNLKCFPWLLPSDERKNIGVVYDGYTHEPIKNALVKLIYKDDVIQVAVTDDFGVFKFVPDDRKYTIVSWKAGYSFPSVIIDSVKDEVYDVIYKGDTIVIGKDRKKFIGVPMDQIERLSKYRVMYWTLDFFIDVLKLINPFLLFSGIVVSLILYSINPYIFYYFVAGLDLVFLIDTMGWFGVKKVHWGVVKDSEKHKLEGIKVGLYSKKFERLIDFRVTDEKGRYRFVVPSGKYYLRIMDKGTQIDGGDVTIDFEKGKTIEIIHKIVVKQV